MPRSPTLRSLEKLCATLAWASFGLGVVAVLGLCVIALATEPQVTPEQFLHRLAIILAASLIPTGVFRALVALFRRARSRRLPDERSLLGSLSLLEDSTIGK